VGLAILSLEFERPRIWLAQLKAWIADGRARFGAWRGRSRGKS
jgi:hypothetical protein